MPSGVGPGRAITMTDVTWIRALFRISSLHGFQDVEASLLGTEVRWVCRNKVEHIMTGAVLIRNDTQLQGTECRINPIEFPASTQTPGIKLDISVRSGHQSQALQEGPKTLQGPGPNAELLRLFRVLLGISAEYFVRHSHHDPK